MFNEVFSKLVETNAQAALDLLEDLALRDDVDHNVLERLYEEVSERQAAQIRAGL